MDNEKKTDETFDISLNNAKIKKFHDEELKKNCNKTKKHFGSHCQSKIKNWTNRNIIY